MPTPSPTFRAVVLPLADGDCDGGGAEGDVVGEDVGAGKLADPGVLDDEVGADEAAPWGWNSVFAGTTETRLGLLPVQHDASAPQQNWFGVHIHKWMNPKLSMPCVSDHIRTWLALRPVEWGLQAELNIR